MQNPPGSYPPPQQGYTPGGFPPSGGYPGGPPPTGKTQTLGLDYNIASGLCYLPVCLIHLIAPILWIATEPKTNKLVRLHAFQSLFGYGLVIAVFIVGWIIGAVIMGVAGAADVAILGLLGFGVIALTYIIAFCLGAFIVIMGLIKGFGGQYWKFPIIGNLAEKFA